MSHPSRVRGLKLGRIYRRDAAQWASHPSRVRGLKCQKAIVEKYKNIVAPFTGAWIEISNMWRMLRRKLSRTLHGCVD